MNGQSNLAFAGDADHRPSNGHSVKVHIPLVEDKIKAPLVDDIEDQLTNGSKREKWGNQWEFLMSCISLSVGLGNVWRFPFTALENGGGAFIIPYLIVLVVIGKPVYYLEMMVGQFCSRGSIKSFDFSPAMRGVAVGQIFATGLVITYYATLLALTIRYFVSSFSQILPWSYCAKEWTDCIDSALKNSSRLMDYGADDNRIKTSAEFYFYDEVLKESDTIHNGIGTPDWKLVICLAFAWICITLVSMKGIQSSGKASYFLAIFPYVIMGVLFVRAVTLPGSGNGVLYFLTPQFDQLLNPKVWYAAVSQVFFSLAICFGNIVNYSSFNQFNQNIYRDTFIVTTLDTCTSLMAGIIIFGILGNLAFVTGTKDITSVVQGGTGLAFVSYPDAISKFEFAPQIFAAVFFFMLFVLGVGTNVGMSSCLMTAIRDRFTSIKHWKVAVVIAVVQFSIGVMYLTPGGQYLLNFIDFFGASFIAFFLAIAELIAFGWIYGVSRLCRDIEFMLHIKTGWYWRLCWGILTPGLMFVIILYSLATFKPLTYNNYVYPDIAYTLGWCLSAIGILQLPIWAIYAIYKTKGDSLYTRFIQAFQPTSDWGPAEPELFKQYMEMEKAHADSIREQPPRGFWGRVRRNIFE